MTGGSLFGSCLQEEGFQIPAEAGTTILALAGFEFWVRRGFQNGLLRSRGANPELRTQKSCGAFEVSQKGRLLEGAVCQEGAGFAFLRDAPCTRAASPRLGSPSL